MCALPDISKLHLRPLKLEENDMAEIPVFVHQYDPVDSSFHNFNQFCHET